MRPTLLLLVAFSLLSSLSLAAPIPSPTPAAAAFFNPKESRDLDPVAAALASKLAAIGKELGRIPVLPTTVAAEAGAEVTPAPTAGDEEEDDDEEDAETTTTTTTRRRPGNPKMVVNPKKTRTSASPIIRRSPSPVPAPQFANNPKHTPSPAPTLPSFPPSSPSSPALEGGVDNPKHVYSYPPGVSVGKWVVIGTGGDGGKEGTWTLEGVSPTHPGVPVPVQTGV
ncbi:hypothetical protein JCM6882_007628 [Rhodosporidiobolus microsporus]